MGMPAARQNDPVIATDTHIVMVPSPGGPVPTPLPHVFNGKLLSGLSTKVFIDGRAAATVQSVAQNQPPHLPTPPGTAFQKPPTNQGRVQIGSTKVFIQGKQAARQGDTVMTCNDPTDAPVGKISIGSTKVFFG